MEDLATGFFMVATPGTLAWIVVGAILGIVLGAIPGLTATMGVVLMLPISLYLEPATGISLLLAVYAGAIAGASIPAILLGIPGNPNAVATGLDGNLMARKGQAGLALGTAALASLIGGLLSLLLLAAFAPLLARATLAFGAAERFALAVLGLTTIVSVSGARLTNGLIAAALGVGLALFGSDPISGAIRLPFADQLRMTPLQGGIGLVPALIGLFGVSQVLLDLDRLGQANPKPMAISYRDLFPKARHLARMWRLTLESTAIGTFIGAIPGAGASIATFLARDQARRVTSRPRSRLGKVGEGSLEGVYAPEVANNAVMCGAMIPLLTLAIPGETVTAVLLGALLVQGITPGLGLFTNELALVYAIFFGIGFALIAMFVFNLVGIRLFPLFLSVPMGMQLPLILLFSLTGAFAIRAQASVAGLYDMSVALVLGVVGYLLRKGGYPVAPIVLGLILGPMMEESFRRAVRLAQGDYLTFLFQPISATILAFAALALVTPMVVAALRYRKQTSHAA